MQKWERPVLRCTSNTMAVWPQGTNISETLSICGAGNTWNHLLHKVAPPHMEVLLPLTALPAYPPVPLPMVCFFPPFTGALQISTSQGVQTQPALLITPNFVFWVRNESVCQTIIHCHSKIKFWYICSPHPMPLPFKRCREVRTG